ncbi:MAG: ATP-binding protein [Enterobacterales bacterium]|nr:ATP-binding protein [Enterobacterales bacterium]
MILRALKNKLIETAGYYPVILLDGPRQAGKSTLLKDTFPNKTYVSLESIDNRMFAIKDPHGFLSEYKKGAIIDEVQNAPNLISYLQEEVDKNPESGRFILSVSQNLAISGLISQSLAGRVGILHLLPLSGPELYQSDHDITSLYRLLWTGGYPRIYYKKIPASQWLADYVATYLQRDVKQLLNISDINRFTTFIKLCAANSSQLLNLSKLGADTGISHNTANSWLSVLEASFICFRLPAWHRNTKKQIVKTPKLHFFDSGLVCHLLGIQTPEQLRFHPLRGAIFETWVASEYYKQQTNDGMPANLFHYREARGLEIDLIVNRGENLTLIESKSGETLHSEHFKNINKLADKITNDRPELKLNKILMFGGDKSSNRHGAKAISWRDI